MGLAEESDAEQYEERFNRGGDIESDQRITKLWEGWDGGTEFDGVKDRARVARDAVDRVVGALDGSEDVGADSTKGVEYRMATGDEGD